MKVAFHRFETGHSRGGALFYYSEVSRILSGLCQGGVRAEPHDFLRLVQDGAAGLDSLISGLGPGDLLVSNIGPYGHLYHFLRERFDGRFRIVRDVRTSSWAGFLLQETLAGPLTREGDLVLFPSEFCRQYFIHLFPQSLSEHNTAVCYPLADSFPKELPPPSARRGLHVGYIGRLSDDKNFDQVLRVFVEVARQRGREVYLHLAGHIDRLSKFKTIGQMRRFLRRMGVAGDRLVYHGHIPYRAIWPFLRSIDVFVFPALANVESFGRVLLEVQHAGVPVVAAHYAAAGEILPAPNLIEPSFRLDQDFNTLEAFSFGRVEEDSVVRAIEQARVGSHCARLTRYQSQTYIDYLLRRREREPALPISGLTSAFIRAVRMQGLRPDLTVEETMTLCAAVLEAYRVYNDNRLTPRMRGLLDAALAGRTFPRRLALYAARLTSPGQQFELGNAREHCWSIGFTPTVRIDGAALAASHVAVGEQRRHSDMVTDRAIESGEWTYT